MPTLDRFLRYDELTAELHALVEEHPSLLAVESIGRSHEGRDVWLVTVTDEATGPHDTKPAHWVDASIHAVELTACVAALHLLDRLVSGHGEDPVVTRALRTRTFYVVPRVNPDGAELALADRPRFVRSSVRRWPWRDGHVPPGLAEGDVDGDGRLLSMRIADPDGGWREHPDEPRLMVRRAFDEPGGPGCYRLLAEGTVTDHDGFTVPTPSDPESLDLNRNFPAGWGTKVQGFWRLPGLGARDRCAAGRGHGAAQRVRVQRVPHQWRRAAATVVDETGQRAAAGRHLDVDGAWPSVHRAHVIPGPLPVRGLHVGQVEADVGRGGRLGL